MKRNTIKKKYKPKTEKEKTETQQMFQLFLSIWDDRCNEFGQCEDFETGKWIPLFLRNNSCCYHHVLYKSDYPQYKLTKKNIIIVSPSTHSQCHEDVTILPKIVEYKKYLLYLHSQEKLL